MSLLSPNIMTHVSIDAAPTLLVQSPCQEMVQMDAPAELLNAVEALNDTVRVLKMVDAC